MFVTCKKEKCKSKSNAGIYTVSSYKEEYDAKTTTTQFGNLIFKGNQVDHPHMLDGLFIFILFQ